MDSRTAGRIGELFQAVNAGLRGVGLHSPVEVMVVGGAAVAMQWNPGRASSIIRSRRLVCESKLRGSLRGLRLWGHEGPS